MYQNNCRACLRPLDDEKPDLKNALFENLEKSQMCIEFIEVTQILVEFNENEPIFVCQTCCDALKVAFQFKKSALESDCLLKNTLEVKLELFEEFLEEARDDYEEEADEKEDQDLQCKDCLKIFKDKKNLAIHRRFHTGIGLKYCNGCTRGFSKSYHLNRHKKICPALRDNKKKGQSQCEDQKSNKVDTGKRILCKVCEVTMESVKSLKLHLDQDHGFKGAEDNIKEHYQIVDKFGGEKSLSDTDSDDENEEERVRYSCSKCADQFKDSKEIMQHMKLEHDMMILDDKCNTCSLQFPCKELLQRHLRQQCENIQKKFTCSSCHVRFHWESSLQMHSEKVHGGLEGRRFQCEECQKCFLRAEHLERHKRTHTTEKKYQCKTCERKFNRADNLKSHMKTHEPDRDKPPASWLCNHCGRSFSSSSNLVSFFFLYLNKFF